MRPHRVSLNWVLNWVPTLSEDDAPVNCQSQNEHSLLITFLNSLKNGALRELQSFNFPQKNARQALMEFSKSTVLLNSIDKA